MDKKSGFTLIELSIVILIIGLIVSGIIFGSALIESARIRSQISQLEKLSLAARTFKMKYEYWPGDIPTSKAIEAGIPQNPYMDPWSSNYGDGNDKVNGRDGSTPTNDMCCEMPSFFYHLQDTNLSADTIDKTKYYYDLAFWPKLKVNSGSGLFVTSYRGNIWFFLGLTSETTGDWVGSFNGAPAITPRQAFSIDSKMDDGVPGAGTVFASAQLTGTNPQPLDTTAGQCVTTSGAVQYNMTGSVENINKCILYVRMQ